MFDGLKARLEQLLRDGARSDPRAYAAGIREAVLEARLGITRMRDALAETDRELAAERKHLDDAERRGRLAAAVPDAETVALAERYAASHRERVSVLERKIVVQREELVLAEREMAEMTTEAKRAAGGHAGRTASRRRWRDLEAAGAVRPPTRTTLRLSGDGPARRKESADRGPAGLPQEEDGEAVKGSRASRWSSPRSRSSVPASAAQQPVAPPPPPLRSSPTPTASSRWDSVTGDLGVAVQSKFPNVGGIVPWARAGVGAVATQSLSNTAYGERGLELIAQGATAEEALRIVMRSDTMLQDRQVGMVDARGNAASFTGTSDLRLGRRPGGRAVGPGQRRGRQGPGRRRAEATRRRPTSWCRTRR